jgi:predicted DNA-binding protein
MAKPHISVRLEQDLADRLKDEADKERRTVSSYVRNLLADSLITKPAAPQHGAAQ